MRTKNARACEKGTDLTATTLIEVRPIRSHQSETAHSAVWRYLGSLRINHLEPEFFTGK
jgi:hypothetical protein